MRKRKYQYFFSQYDVWSNADHWMTSASKDIFYHFYKSIRATFKEQFINDDITEIVEKILHLRDWHRSNIININRQINEKELDLHLNSYQEGRKPVPKDYVIKYVNGEGLVTTKDELLSPNVVYKDFNDFFYNADHGFNTNDDGKIICKELHDFFIQDFNIESLKEQFSEEFIEYKQEQEEMVKEYKEYLQSNSPLTFTKWCIKKSKKGIN